MTEPDEVGPTTLRPRNRAPAADQPAEAPEPPPESDSSGSSGSSGSTGIVIPPAVRRLAALAGSTTVLTGLLFYFGASHAYYFYDYLGVDSSLLNLSTRDYLQLSVDGLFVPVLVAGMAGLLLLWAQVRFGPSLTRLKAVHTVSVVVCVAGVLLMLNGASRVLVSTPLNQTLAVAPLSLGIGAGLLFYGMRLQRQLSTGGGDRTLWASSVEWLALALLVGLALFWVANDYSAEVGRSRAQQFVSELPSLPSAQVYSAHDLSISAPGVTETRCRTRDATYRYRYDGLKLVLQSGDEYLLLPTLWSRSDGVAILLPRNDNVRLQFEPAGVLVDPNQPC